MREEPGERPSESRIREAATLGVDTFVVACPKDYTMYTDAVKTAGYEGRMVVCDVAELVAQAVGVRAEVLAQV
jgi:Fe-S oxidoreductase